MAARAIWNGGINFGMIHIPVRLYSAETHDEINFDMLDARNMGRVRYKRVNEDTGREVEWDDIVKGYEYKKGKYVTVTDDDFEEARRDTSPNIEIQDFVRLEDIHTSYFERPYFLLPGKNGEKGYVLLREALKRSGFAAVGTVVLRQKEHLVLVFPEEDALALNIIRYRHELKSVEEFSFPSASAKKLGITPREIRLAERLVDELRGEWHPEKYKDRYRDRLEAIINEKIKSGGERENQLVELPKPTKAVDMMELLKQSVESLSGGKKKPTTKKATPKNAPTKNVTSSRNGSSSHHTQTHRATSKKTRKAA